MLGASFAGDYCSYIGSLEEEKDKKNCFQRVCIGCCLIAYYQSWSVSLSSTFELFFLQIFGIRIG